MPGKWGLHTFYLKAHNIKQMLPETRLLSGTSLRELLRRYGSVYIKPNMEHTGKGIMKAWKSAKEYHLVKVNDQKMRFFGINTLIKHILKITGKKPHIVQRTIQLDTYLGRPYDIRVMMMRDKNNKWLYTGMLAKVMGPSSIISNVQRGRGYATTVGQVLKESSNLKPKQHKEIEGKLIQTSYVICNRFNRYKYSSQIGIDYAVDNRSRLWLIEVNFDYPSHSLFARLPDKSMYHLIKRRRAEYLKFRKRHLC
jgi:hypothetical protein